MLPPGIDRISALPDEMLIHILSFLPTKFAFTTSILSKRWISLCHLLTSLRFDDKGVKDKEDYRRFCQFVDTVLLSPRAQHHPIETFSLMHWSRSIVFDLYQFNVDEWVEAAKRRGVKNLELTTEWPVSLSPSIFTSRNIAVLKINRFHMGVHDFDFGSIHLPNLRTLHLRKAIFNKREDFNKILSGCPNLVDLYAPVLFVDYNYIRGYATLPMLEKACFHALDVPFTTIYNVEFLRIELMERRFIEKDLNSHFRGMLVLRNLISIELCFYIFTGWDDVVEVLPYCPKLQSLVIERPHHDCQRYNKEKWAFTEPVPECFSLHLRTCSIQNYQGRNDDFKFVEFILQNASFLQVMTLHNERYTKEDEKQRVFKHLSHCLRISPACKIFLDTEEINQQEPEELICAT